MLGLAMILKDIIDENVGSVNVVNVDTMESKEYTSEEFKQMLEEQEKENKKEKMTKQEIHTRLCCYLDKLFRDKNSDYGDSFSKVRDKYPDAILIRLNDKISRLEKLYEKDYTAKVEESIEDTLLDIANYAIMELMEMYNDAQQTDEG